MSYYTAQVIIPTADNVAANYATNTFHFFADSTAILPSITTALKSFYSSLSANMSNMVRANTWQIKYYDDVDPEPRAPVLIETYNTGLTFSNQGLPPEVSLCISFQGAQVSGVPQARKRGRVYIPYITQASNHTDGRPTSATITQFVGAADALLGAAQTASTWSWVTFSRVAPGYSEVTNGWVDNEWDTQRRRGRPYTLRTTFA